MLSRVFVFFVAALMLAVPTQTQAQTPMPEGHTMPPGMDHSQHQMMMSEDEAADMPIEAGQAAFATVQEILEILEADPNTDWSQVSIRRLRDHLVDMDDVFMRTDATVREIDGGIEATVTGEGRVRDAIQRMVTAHTSMLTSEMGWQARGEATPTGARLTVTASDAADVAKIRALGFYGVMASGAHHQPHHLGMARGDMVHGG